MKQFFLLLSLTLSLATFAQDIPNVSVKDVNGKVVNFKDIISSDKPFIISFWATWCVPCINELDAISEVYPDWQEETDVTLIAISVDDERTARRIKALVNGKAWEYDIYRDFNQALTRAFNIPSVPFVVVIKNGKVVHTHSGYTPGSEDDLYDIISKK